VKKLVLGDRQTPRGGIDLQSLSNVLFESADLLESARESQDESFQAQAVELAIRALYAGSAAIDRQHGRRPGNGLAPIIKGPWA
jgi:hypothetical protein